MQPLGKLTGKVIHGDKTGTAIGFPTANLLIDTSKSSWLNWRNGVYVCKCHVNSDKYKNKQYYGLLHIGPRSVLGETEKKFEVYILDFSDSIYDTVIDLEIIKHIRNSKKTKTLEEMVELIKEDVVTARALISAL